MKRSKWALLAVLLGVMVAMSGCFGGRYATGGVTGFVYEPPEGETTPYFGKPLVAGKPLQNARVTATGTRGFAVTDENGCFKLTGIPVGSQTITISNPSYKPKSIKVRIPAYDILSLEEPIKLAGKGYYLLIGVGKGYTDELWDSYDAYIEPLPPYFDPEDYYLNAPGRDVSILRDVLVSHNRLKIGRVERLIDGEATWTAVVTALEDFSYVMNPEDYLVIYFSGHGVPDGILLADSILSDAKFRYEILEDIFPAGTDVTLILDTCYSGSFADKNEEFIPLVPPGAGSKAFAGQGYTVIASSRPTELSHVRDPKSEVEPSIFTYYLVQAIRNGNADINFDGVITVQEVYNYVEWRVQNESLSRYGLKQNVYVWLYDSSSVIATYPVDY